MIKTRLFLASAAAMLLSAACTDEVPEIPASELYTREFVKEFGVIDGRQDWNNASRGNVQVNTAKSSRVRVTAVIGTHNYLLADYEDVQGKRTLSFDIPKGVTDITVSDGITDIDAVVGGSVDFASESRAGGSVSGGDTFVTVTDITGDADKDKWKIIPWIDAKRFTRKMPEGCYNGNRPGVSTDFMFTTTGTSIIIYPLYWDTSSNNTLGIYYLDEQGSIVYVPVYNVGAERYNNWNPGDDAVYTFVNSEVKHFTLKDGDEAVIKAFGGRKLSELPVQDNVTEPGVGEAPQMLLIYQGTDSKWRWPMERHQIDTAYKGFSEWMKGGKYDVNTEGENWFDMAEEGHVVNR